MAKAPKKTAVKKPRTPARPGGLAHGRWLGDFPDLSAAELRLVECCARGEVWKPEGWDGTRPTEKSETNTIKAELIRFLALGGDAQHPVHEQGVMVEGAWIRNVLDLHQCRDSLGISVKFSHFDSEPFLEAAHVPELSFSGSWMPGLNAGRLEVLGSVFLRNGFTAIGEVRLLGARIGGSLDCVNGSVINRGGDAIYADRIKVAGNLFLSDGFSANGAVRLLGAEIGGDLDFNKGRITNIARNALSAGRIRIAGCLFVREAIFEGSIKLNAARIATIVDSKFAWLKNGNQFDGLHYDRIIGSIDSAHRIAWLYSQSSDYLNAESWRPQPWEQLIKVLREMGHGYEAGEIAMAKQDHMRKAGIIKGPLRRGFHWLYGLLAGYGHRPVRTIAAMLTVWLACAFFFQIGGNYGYVGPGTPLLNNADLAHDVAEQCGHRFETGKTVWTRCPAMPAEYTTFQPLAYSLDLILPLVDLQQDTDWAPIVEDPPGNNLGYGVFLRWLMWFEILFGWAMSLMLVAVLGRLVEKD